MFLYQYIAEEPGWPSHHDGDINTCIHGDAWSDAERYDHERSIRKTSFDLPTSADLLYLLSRGHLSHGNLTVSQGDSIDDQVHIEVAVLYKHQRVLDLANVCYVTRGDNEHGVGIYVSALCLSGNAYLPH